MPQPKHAVLSPLAIYIHWPWCKAKCPYCDFNSHAGTIEEQSYVNGVLNEFSSWANNRLIAGHKTQPFNASERRIESIFFGGGTPSLMSPKSLEQLIDFSAKMGRLDASTEVTVECNPTSFSDQRKAIDFFSDLKATGVNRVSIGVQGLKAEWLAFLGRSHAVEDALATLDAAQQVFDNVNSDVIYGLPEQDLNDWTLQLEDLGRRGLSHISAYQLTVEPNTHFYKDVKMGRWQPISGDLEADFFDATKAILAARGYENYEISNFAQPGKACRHNVHVWRYGEYLGLGAGAHGRLMTSDGSSVATQVIRQPEGYLRRAKAFEDVISSATLLNGPEAVQEAILLGLRLAEGVDMENLSKRFGEASCKEAISARETRFLMDSGLLTPSSTHLQLTPLGWPRLNSVLTRILPPLTPSTPLGTPLISPISDAYKKPVTVTIE